MKYAILLSLVITTPIANLAQSQTRYFRENDYEGGHHYKLTHEVMGNDSTFVRCYRCSYDEQGRLTLWQFISHGRMIPDPTFGVAQIRISYETDAEKHEYFDAAGRPVPATGTGEYSEKCKYDLVTHRATNFEYGLDGNLLTEDLLGASQYLWLLDKKGNMISEFYLDAKGNKIIHDSMVFERRWKYDNRGNEIEESYYNQGGHLVMQDFEARDVRVYNSNDQVIETRFFDNKGKLLRSVQIKYDSLGYQSETSLLNESNEVYVRNVFTYDGRGNELTESDYGADGELIAENASRHCTYDDFNRLVEYRVTNRDGAVAIEEHATYSDLMSPVETEIANFATGDGSTLVTKF